jgi:excisionase family DNA binding protein
MSVKDVAHYLGVSERTVRTLIADGELVPIRVGRQLRFDERTLDAYVRRRVER